MLHSMLFRTIILCCTKILEFLYSFRSITFTKFCVFKTFCRSILNKLAQLLIAVLNYIVRSNDTRFDATKASTDLVFVILNTDSKMKQEGIDRVY